jgi:HlyD family secretion protein
LEDPRKNLFRKAALEKLASPERLDVMMQVTSPLGWLALIALGFAIVGIVIWSVAGSIAIKVQGNGILLRGKNVLAVNASARGQLSKILVQPGDNVRAGEAVAKLGQPDLMLKIQNTRELMAELQGQAGRQNLSQDLIREQRVRQKQDLLDRVKQQQEAADRGLIPQSRVLQTKAEITNIDQQIASMSDNTGSRDIRIADVRRELKELENQLDSSAEVLSEYDGRVIEITTSEGDMVGPGMRLLNLEAFDAPIEAVIYIPAQDGKKVRPGMEVLISPSTVKAEEYGFIKGEVKSVSDYPMSSEALLRVLRNEKLVDTLTGKSAPIEISVKLLPDVTTPSGFKWSSSVGPPNPVFSGTPCAATVSVERKTPISYVIPLFRKAMGVSS